jgi:hypothetical protein
MNLKLKNATVTVLPTDSKYPAVEAISPTGCIRLSGQAAEQFLTHYNNELNSTSAAKGKTNQWESIDITLDISLSQQAVAHSVGAAR